MTEEQIKKAAYKLCELRGVAPEERIEDKSDNPHGFDVCSTTLRWCLVAKEVKKFDMISRAIKEATSGGAVFGFGVTRNEPDFEPEGGIDGFKS